MSLNLRFPCHALRSERLGEGCFRVPESTLSHYALRYQKDPFCPLARDKTAHGTRQGAIAFGDHLYTGASHGDQGKGGGRGDGRVQASRLRTGGWDWSFSNVRKVCAFPLPLHCVCNIDQEIDSHIHNVQLHVCASCGCKHQDFICLCAEVNL